MLHLIESKQASIFEDIYDTYSPLLYGIILKISKNTKEAEEILIASFKTFSLQNEKPGNNDTIFLRLLRITICTTSEKVNLPIQSIGKIIFKDLRSNTTMQFMEPSFIPVNTSQHTFQVSANIG